MKNRLIVLVLFFAFLISTIGCAQNIDLLKEENTFQNSQGIEDLNYFDAVDKGPVRGGVLEIFSPVPDTLNPLETKSVYVRDFLSLIYDGLVSIGENQSPQPSLSDYWEVSEDGLIWTFHIRQNVRWHDGELFESDDVLFTLNYLKSLKGESVYSNSLLNILTYEAIDHENFKIALKKPNSFTAEMMNFPILPQHKAQDSETASPGNIYVPVGTGLYKFSSQESNEEIVLSQNENWWYFSTPNDRERQYAYIDDIIVRLYDDPKAAVSAFQEGEVHFAVAEPSSIGSYAGRTDVMTKEFTSREFTLVAFNTKKGLFKDQYARNAIAAAINKNTIIAEECMGKAEASDYPVLPKSWIVGKLTNENITKTSVDILNEGGWKKNDKGYTKIIDGKPYLLELDILVNNKNMLRVAICENIAKQLRSQGIGVTVTAIDLAELDKKISSGDFNAVCVAVNVPQYPDVSNLYSQNYITSSSTTHLNTVWNISGYNNPELDILFQGLYSARNIHEQMAFFCRCS